MFGWFKRNKDKAVIGHELSVPIKDLGICLYEEFEKVERLKLENEKLQDEVSDMESLKTEKITQLTLINQLKREIDQKDRKIKQFESEIHNKRESVENYKSDIGIQKSENEMLRRQIKEMESGLLTSSYNKALNDAIAELEGYRVLGKNQAICAINNMLIAAKN